MWNNQKGLKIRKLFIKHYNNLRDFEINFCDKDEQPLPIIVLTGINGIGKTSILEYLSKKQDVMFINDTITNFDFIQKAIVKFIDKLIYEQDIKASEVYKQCKNFIKDTLKGIELNIEFSRLDKDKNIIFTTNNSEFLFNSLSLGEKQLFAKVLHLYLTEVKDKIILINKPESSLHPAWQSRILKLYENYAQQNNCQIIIATHSPFIIGSAKNKYIRVLYYKDSKVDVLENTLAYGRSIEWVLKEVMNLDLLRDETINKYFDKIHQLIEEDKLCEAEEEIQNLEQIIGFNDNLILNLRNEIDFKRI
jgi:predicted ATP-dependent endonuclease of OLD family